MSSHLPCFTLLDQRQSVYTGTDFPSSYLSFPFVLKAKAKDCRTCMGNHRKGSFSASWSEHHRLACRLCSTSQGRRYTRKRRFNRWHELDKLEYFCKNCWYAFLCIVMVNTHSFFFWQEIFSRPIDSPLI